MTICIANEKGGSGKNTLCLNLAVQLLKDNKEVVVLDTDSQKSMETFTEIRSNNEYKTFSLFNRSSGFSDTLKHKWYLSMKISLLILRGNIVKKPKRLCF